MKTRNFYLNAFIKKHHLEDIMWLSQDASTRRYARVHKGDKTFILVDSPLTEKPKEFVLIDRILRKHQFGAPRIYAKDLRHGFLLLEDFGTCSLSCATRNPKKADELYILALDTLIKIQKEITEHRKLPPALPVMWQENNLFIDYYVPKIAGVTLTEKAKEEFKAIWRQLFDGFRKLPHSIVLYDYHLDNLMLKSDNTLGLLDFQDAMSGPIFYDLISLVEDERFPLPQNKRKQMLQHYFELRPLLAEKKYADWLPVIAAHRHTRVMGIFARLATVYNKPHYLKYIKNDWAFLRENLKSPLLKAYTQWIKKYLKNPKDFK